MEGEGREEPSGHARARTVGPLASTARLPGTAEGKPPKWEHWRNPGVGNDIIPSRRRVVAERRPTVGEGSDDLKEVSVRPLRSQRAPGGPQGGLVVPAERPVVGRGPGGSRGPESSSTVKSRYRPPSLWSLRVTD
ncbi:unnamed protein product [Arctogadus glacialis]